MVRIGDKCDLNYSLRSVFFFDGYPTICDRAKKCKRFFVVDTCGDWNLVEIQPKKVFSDKIVSMLEKMITNVHILMDDDQVVHAMVDTEMKITAAYQNMRHIPSALVDNYGHWVEILDFSHNNLRDVEKLDTAFRLHTLILDHNLIASGSYFPWMPQLRVLWLNHNLVHDLGVFVPALARACPNLVHLSLMGNAAARSVVMGGSEVEQDKYRRYVISYFDNLRHLDDKPVTTIDRLRSETQHGAVMNNLLSVYKEVRSVFRFNLGKHSSCVV